LAQSLDGVLDEHKQEIIKDHESLTSALVEYCKEIMNVGVPVRKLASNTKLGMQAFQHLQQEAKKDEPDKAKLKRFSAKAYQYLSEAKFGDDAEAKMTSLNERTRHLTNQAQEAEKKLKKYVDQKLKEVSDKGEHIDELNKKMQRISEPSGRYNTLVQNIQKVSDKGGMVLYWAQYLGVPSGKASLLSDAAEDVVEAEIVDAVLCIEPGELVKWIAKTEELERANDHLAELAIETLDDWIKKRPAKNFDVHADS
jgi:uncharacterized protein (DUF3084 family)